MTPADPELQRRYLEAMGIQVWEPRAGAQPGRKVTASEALRPAAEAPDAEAPVASLSWVELRARVAACTRCTLHQTRTQTVFGVGDEQADWLVVGEAPGADEDAQGEPFVGRAGQLLNAMLKAVGFDRGQVYIANILKCRPPNNRDPRPEEVVCCEPYLQRQVALIRPRVILAVGRIAAQNLLKTEAPIGRLRGRVHAYGEPEIPVIATYHPAYLLRSPAEKRKAWMDLQLAYRTYRDQTGTRGSTGDP
jgi:DNA polymerase